MTTAIRICLLGFGSSELSALHALVRLMMRRGQTCTVVHKLADADLVVGNADDPETMRQLWATSSVRRVLLVGQSDGATGWPVLPRPMKLLAILDTIDALLATPPVQRSGAAQNTTSEFAATRPYAPGDSRISGLDSTASGFPPTQPFVGHDALAAVPRVQIPVTTQVTDIDAKSIEQWRAAQRERRGPDQSPKLLQARVPNHDGLATTAPPLQVPSQHSSESLLNISAESATVAPPPTPLAEALVVDDSNMSRCTLQSLLHRQGLRADVARSGEEALRQVMRRPYRFVFLDELAGDMDALKTARSLRKFKPASGERPLVVMLSNRGGAFDRLRSRLAGCDAYLVKPLDDSELARVLTLRTT